MPRTYFRARPVFHRAWNFMCSHVLSTVSYALRFTMAWTSLAQKISKMHSYDLPSVFLARQYPMYSVGLREPYSGWASQDLPARQNFGLLTPRFQACQLAAVHW